MRAASLGGAVAGGVGVLALLGWALRLPLLASLWPDKIPMAPSTALLFVLYGIAALLRARLPLGRGVRRAGVAINSVGALVAFLLLLFSFFGIRPLAEHLGFAVVSTVGEETVGHMSPVTAICFLLASLSFLGPLLPFSTRSRKAQAAWWTACLLLATSSTLLLAYLFGSPLFYAGSFIPPAATTSLAFAALATTLLPLARRRTGPPARLPRPLVLVFILLTVGIVTMGGLYSRGQERHYRAQVEQQLRTVAELKANELAQWRAEQLGDASVLLGNTALSGLARQVFTDPADAEAREELRGWLAKIQLNGQFDRVSLLDAEGVERLAVPDELPLVSSFIGLVVPGALASREALFLDFYRDEHDGRIYLNLLVPVFEGHLGSPALGIFALRIDPETYLYPFLSRWPAPAQTAETLLVRRDGNDVLFLNELKFRKHTALTLRIPLENHDVPAVKAVLGQEGIVEGPDYRGIPALAAVRAVAGSPWYLVARIDAAEVNAPMRERLWLMVVLVGSMVAAAVTGAGSLWREQHVRHLRERYEAEQERTMLIEGVTDYAILRLDWAGHVVSWNAGAARLTGYRADEIIGQHFSLFYAEDDVARGKPPTDLETAASEGRLEDESWHARKDGSRFWASVIITALRDQSGQLQGFARVARDLTERRRAAQMLQQSQKIEAIGRLAGGVAHDFNNILSVILGYGELAQHELGPGHPAHEQIAQVLTAAKRAADLTKQLLAFSRKQVMQPKLLDLDAVVANTRRMLGRLIGEDITLVVQTTPGLGTVNADPSQIEQITLNLAVNARDAMPKGGCLKIETANADLDEGYALTHPPATPGRYVMLAISDTGIGMDQETQQHLFEPFFTTKPEGQGTGLGLATVYGIVKQSGGYIWVYSEPGRGTTFKVYLPRVDEPAETPAAATPAQAPRGSETILLVEDNKALRELVQKMLEERGYTVLLASNGDEALALAREREGPIDLLLTDVVMPNLGGGELAKLLSASLPGLRVLYMSGYTDGEIARHGLLRKGIVLLQKPFTRGALGWTVRQALDRPDAGSEPLHSPVGG